MVTESGAHLHRLLLSGALHQITAYGYGGAGAEPGYFGEIFQAAFRDNLQVFKEAAVV